MAQDVQFLAADQWPKEIELCDPAPSAGEPADGFSATAPAATEREGRPAMGPPVTQIAFIGPVNEPTFANQLNGALRRLARAGHEVTDIKFVSDGRLYSALVLYHPWQENGAAGPPSENA